MAGTASRRRFLMAGGAALALDLNLPAAPGRRKVKFGLAADIHQDVIHDAGRRLEIFLREARASKRDFIVQLGDFCRPYEKNRAFLDLWNSYPGGRYHVLGNHENDGGFTWEQVMAYLGMTAPYYSFDQGGWHFVVLNGNEKNPAVKASGYPRYIGEEQARWIESDLKKTAAPTVVFSHQSLEDGQGVENREAIRGILEAANREAGWGKVGACFSGHHHIDYATTIGGIHYVQVNSMSYSWLGSRYQHVRYSEAIDKEFPYIRQTAPYAEPLFAMVTLRPEGRVEIRGCKTEFVGPSPWELGMEDRPGTSNSRERLAPRVSDRTLRVR